MIEGCTFYDCIVDISGVFEAPSPVLCKTRKDYRNGEAYCQLSMRGHPVFQRIFLKNVYGNTVRRNIFVHIYMDVYLVFVDIYIDNLCVYVYKYIYDKLRFGTIMSIKSVVINHYREKVNAISSQCQKMTLPNEGWLCSVRKALGMSAVQLARRLGKSRSLVHSTEKAELEGGVTLKTMRATAEAMGCRFVYAIVPQDKTIEDVLYKQAHMKAQKQVIESGKHMALEQQSLSPERIDFEVKRLEQELLRHMPADFWDEEA